jgi:uncharacterized membrane-anchored protein YitT (DUF2179 family)
MKKVIMKLLGIFLGSFLVAISISLFIIPHGFISGGISGVSLIIFYTTGIPVSVLIYLFNIPIVAMGGKYVGKSFALYSAAGITILAALLQYFKSFPNLFPSLTNDPVLASIFAGILTGVGGGIVFKNGGTLGGTDILAFIVKKKYEISIGDFLLYTNIIIMTLSLFLFNPEIIMYTLISMYIASKVTDAVQDGINTKTSVMIISEHYDAIAQAILMGLKRGVTFLHAEGGFWHQEKKVILCFITKFELSKLKEISLKIDKSAFISVSETKEVLGKGF